MREREIKSLLWCVCETFSIQTRHSCIIHLSSGCPFPRVRFRCTVLGLDCTCIFTAPRVDDAPAQRKVRSPKENASTLSDSPFLVVINSVDVTPQSDI